ncbi:hypothetical protein LCGC14_2622920 [marine sediment metagenome]|uniref:Uncharacterized protein n=1 Tax=marine sediment metagenome TaxID=412755 RepID=A0A0F9AQ71_9ZZZZ
MTKVKQTKHKIRHRKRESKPYHSLPRKKYLRYTYPE